MVSMPKGTYKLSYAECGSSLARLEVLVSNAHRVIADSAKSDLSKDAYKWKLGALIAEIKDVADFARERVLDPAIRVMPGAKEEARECMERFKAFITSQDTPRDTLVDYAAVSKMFPPGDLTRTELSFSHARAISRVKVPQARQAWTQRAIEGGWSVARLQAEINVAGRPIVDSCGRGGGTFEEQSPTPNSTWVCAQTGKHITDRASMVELRVQPESTLDATLDEKIDRGKNRGEKRGGAAKKKRNGELRDAPRILRFGTALDLLDWLAARQDAGDLKAVDAGDQKAVRQASMPGPPENKGSQVVVWPAFKKSVKDTSLMSDTPASGSLAERTDGPGTAEGETDALQ